MRVQEIAIIARILGNRLQGRGKQQLAVSNWQLAKPKNNRKSKTKIFTTEDTEDTEKNRNSKVKGKTNISPRRHGDAEKSRDSKSQKRKPPPQRTRRRKRKKRGSKARGKSHHRGHGGHREEQEQ